MKSLILTVTLLLTPLVSSATLLDFNDPNNLGVSLGGDMTWNGIGGGHLYNESWDTDDFINFSSDTYVNSFEMNLKPWEGSYDATEVGTMIDITGFDSSNQVVWSDSIDLSNYLTWDNWLTVSVETADIMQLAFTAPGNDPYFKAFWPSIDNMIINEAIPSAVPVPAAAWLFGSALLGFFGFSRRKASA